MSTTIAPSTALPVTATNINKTFGSGAGAVPVLSDINLHVEPGTTTVILGPSGCGKSTLLRLIAGLDQPTGGTVELGGQPVTGIDARASVVFQEPRLLPWRSVARNVALGARGRVVQAEVTRWLELVGLAEFAGFLPRQISGGMAQRAALARALISEPGVLLLDEPFAALDALTRLRMQDLLIEVATSLGTTVLLVTHDVDEALYLGDQVVVLGDRGQGVAEQLRVPLARPRDRSDQSLVPLRRSLLSRFGIHV